MIFSHFPKTRLTVPKTLDRSKIEGEHPVEGRSVSRPNTSVIDVS